MNEEIIETIEKNKKEKKKIPDDIKKDIDKKVFQNILIAVVIMLYFIFIELGYLNIKKEIFITDLKVFSITLVAITIILFEKAYKNDSGKLAINGIEALILGLITLALPYTFFYLNPFYKWLGTMAGLLFAIYYTIKSIFIHQKIKKEYIQSLSDIKEIVKKEKRIKKNFEENQKESIKKEKITEKKENEKKVPKKKIEAKDKTKTLKTQQQKKKKDNILTKKKEEVKTSKKETTSKKAGVKKDTKVGDVEKND